MRLLVRGGLSLALGLAASAASAQQPGGTVRGLVYDSLATRAPLAGADVWLVGGAYQGTADGAGRFQITGVAPGHYRVAFAHPALDVLALTAPVQEIDVADGATVDVTLVTPSDATLYARACPEPRAVGSGLILGDVAGPAGEPASSAVVRLIWRAWTLRPGEEPHDDVRDATLTVDQAGRFSVCGVPNDRVVTFAASLPPLGQAITEVRLGDREVGFARLRLGPTAVAAVQAVAPEPAESPVIEAAGTGLATLRGAVRDRNGKAVPQARVKLLGPDVTALTQDDGTFQFANVPREVQTVEVSLIGFVPRRVEVDLRPGRLERPQIALERTAYVLSPLNVKGQEADPMRRQLAQRVQYGNGQFVTREQIEQRHAVSVSDLMKGMRGVQLRSQGMGTVITMSRGGSTSTPGFGNQCVPVILVDGSPVGGEMRDPSTSEATSGALAANRSNPGVADNKGTGMVSMARDVGPDQFVSVDQIEVIEVYESTINIPGEFRMFSNNCGLVAIWTKRGAPPVIKEQGE